MRVRKVNAVDTPVNKSIEKRVDQSDRVDRKTSNIIQPNPDQAIFKVLGMKIEETLAIWYQKGRPLIHLGPRENCEDLTKLLNHYEIKPDHLSAVKEWLNKVTNKEGA